MRNAIAKVVGNLDRGFYQAALSGKDSTGAAAKRSSYGYLTDLMLAEGVGPTEQEIEKRVRMLFLKTRLPEAAFLAMPDSQQESLEQYAFDSWGLEKALEDQGVRVKGAGADKLEKLFTTTTSTILFPAYVESQVMAGRLSVPILASLIATETNIDSHTYQSLWMADTQADRELKVVGEGAVLPTTTIRTAERAISLWKFGRLLEATYESLRLTRLNVVGAFLQRVGIQLALDETDWAVQTLIAGDGNTGSNITNANDIDADVQGVLDYDELVKLYLAFPEGYGMTTALARDANIRTILNMSEFKDPMSGFTFQRNGVLPGPMGANWFRYNSTGATSMPALGVLAIDNSIALEQVTEQGVMTESDKLIDRQIDRTAITKWTGFAKLDYNATQFLDVNAEL